MLYHSACQRYLHAPTSCTQSPSQCDSCSFTSGDVSFHSGWTFHQACGNNTDKPREVFTIIFMVSRAGDMLGAVETADLSSHHLCSDSTYVDANEGLEAAPFIHA